MGRGRVYYAKLARGKSMFLAPRVSCRTSTPCGACAKADEAQRLSRDARAVLKVLRGEWEMATADLREESGVKDRKTFAAAMDELQAAMIVIPSAAYYLPKFTYVWTLAVGAVPRPAEEAHCPRRRAARDRAFVSDGRGHHGAWRARARHWTVTARCRARQPLARDGRLRRVTLARGVSPGEGPRPGMTWLLALLTAVQFGASSGGELRLTVTDPAGLPIECAVTLTSDASDVARTLQTNAAGLLVARYLPAGKYRLEVARPGFTNYTGVVDIGLALPTHIKVTLGLASLSSQLTVSPDATLLDAHQTGAVSRLGPQSLERRTTSGPGRSISDLVNAEPGWLLEANGILHPRGSEYQVQYVVDGLPMTDNRSPAFAPPLEADDAHALTIYTSGFPAEYGRKLGGVIEVVSHDDGRSGLHGRPHRVGRQLWHARGAGHGAVRLGTHDAQRERRRRHDRSVPGSASRGELHQLRQHGGRRHQAGARLRRSRPVRRHRAARVGAVHRAQRARAAGGRPVAAAIQPRDRRRAVVPARLPGSRARGAARFRAQPRGRSPLERPLDADAGEPGSRVHRGLHQGQRIGAPGRA